MASLDAEAEAARAGKGASLTFAGRRPQVIPHGPLHLVIDSTGLKLFGQGEWDEEKHGRVPRSWRKLHLADNAADDAGQVPALLGQIEGEIASVTADGAYDGEPVYQAVARRQSDPVPDIVIPPRSSAVLSRQSTEAQSQRDHHIRIIAEKGRMAWQKATGYGRRNLAETAVGRYKAIIGPKLRARILPAQQGETAIATEVLNRMIRVAKPVSIRAP